MRHPALTRIFAIVLAILSLVMLTAGALGISSAREDRSGAEEDYERLQGRIEEYKTVLQKLQGTTSYDEVSQELEQRQEEHDSEASQHKSDLAMYSATKSGVNSGEDALRQAESTLQQGWEQYNQGFEQLQQGLDMMNDNIDLSATLSGLLDDIRAFDPSFPTPQAPTGPAASALSETTPAPPEPAPEQVYMKSDLVNAFNSLAAAYDQLAQFVKGASGLLSGLSATGTLPAEQAAMLQGAQEKLNLIDPSSLETAVKTLSSTATYLSTLDEEVSKTTVETGVGDAPSIKKGYEDAAQKFNVAQNSLGGMAVMLPAMTETLQAAKKQLQDAADQLAQGRVALEQGDAQLAAGKAELQATENELERDGQRLDQEKLTLEQEAQNLEQLKEKAQQQQELEQRETSLRLMLLDREGIQERVDGGMELLSSAEDYGYQLQRESQEEYMNRFITCVIMIVGGLAGFACIPAAFEKLRSRFMLIAPAILGLLCAAAAETIFVVIGRGSSYSAIFAGIFAALYLLIVVPKAKSPAPKAE